MNFGRLLDRHVSVRSLSMMILWMCSIHSSFVNFAVRVLANRVHSRSLHLRDALSNARAPQDIIFLKEHRPKQLDVLGGRNSPLRPPSLLSKFIPTPVRRSARSVALPPIASHAAEWYTRCPIQFNPSSPQKTKPAPPRVGLAVQFSKTRSDQPFAQLHVTFDPLRDLNH